MGDQNPWEVENIEVFSFYCCPECDFKSKNGDHFKRHALESHHKAKSFFIKPKNKKTEKTTGIKCVQVKTDSERQNKINEGLEDFVPSNIKVEEESLSESEGEEFVRLSEQKGKSLNFLNPDFIINKDLESFGDDETVDTFEDKLKTFDDQKLEDNVEELDTFDGENYEDITDSETSNDNTFDVISKELETFDKDDLEKFHTFNKDKFEKFEKEYKCETCSSKFANKNVLANHMIDVHMKIKDFKCKDCSKIFPTRYRMESHHKFVHLLIKPPQRYPYTCNECETSFKKRQQMEWHINKVHLNYKPHKCNLCKKSFLRAAELNRHMKRAHKEKK